MLPDQIDEFLSCLFGSEEWYAIDRTRGIFLSCLFGSEAGGLP